MTSDEVEQIPRDIFVLPNEILLNVFGLYPTKELVAFAPTCRRMYSLVARILQYRLQVAAGLDGHTLYLECGPPSAKWMISKVFCSVLGTDGLQELAYETRATGGTLGQLGRMGELYSRFRPMNKEPDFRSVPRPHPAGDVPGSRTYRSAEETAAAWQSYTQDAVTRSINIDANFLFSQLETVAYLGKREPTRRVLLSVQEVCEGTIRVWRDWLAKQCENKRWSDGENIVIHHEEPQPFLGKGKERSDSIPTSIAPRDDPTILWLNKSGGHVGIKFRVKERKWQRENPVLFESEVEVPVSYRVELEEVVVRTTHLLFKLEELRKQVSNETGSAMIFGSYLE